VAVEILVIPLSFIILGGILLWILVGAKGKWWLKFILIVFVPLMGVLIWQSIDSYLGWPTGEEPPERFVLLWGVVYEPNPQTGFEGIIYVWGDPSVFLDTNKTETFTFRYKDIFRYKPKEGEPRAYKMPYSRDLQEGLEEAKKKVAKGERVVMERRKIEKSATEEGGKGNNKEGKGGKGEREGKPGKGEGERGQPGGTNAGGRNYYYKGDYEYIFYNLPPAKLPAKNPPKQ
jgi:hypothetical protein